ncbi:MAG: hypothetical protein ABSC72_02800 [Methylovirgula sp.]|jgi:hypothetical protein
MTRSTHAFACTLAAALLFASIKFGGAQAMFYAHIPSSKALPSPPLTRSAVVCGAMGCLPVTRVKRCAPETVNHGLPAQRAIIVRHTCNFL